MKETSNEKVRMQLAGACSSFVPSRETLIGCVCVLLKTAKRAVQMPVLYCHFFVAKESSVLLLSKPSNVYHFLYVAKARV